MVSLIIKETTSNAISVILSGLNVGYSYTRDLSWYIKKSSSSNYPTDPHGKSMTYPHAETAEYVYTNLKSNTKYDLKVTIKMYDDPNLVESSTTAKTLSVNIYPWRWSFPVEKGSNFALTSGEWISFCNRIDQVRAAFSMYPKGFTLTPDFVSEDKPFPAWIFLQASTAIAEISNNGGGVDSRCLSSNYIKSGLPITAFYFTNLEAALNNLIKYI